MSRLLFKLPSMHGECVCLTLLKALFSTVISTSLAKSEHASGDFSSGMGLYILNARFRGRCYFVEISKNAGVCRGKSEK